MHINEIERFYTMSMWTLANNIIIPHMIQNGQTVVEIWAFQDFYIKPRLLINMHDIITKINRAHLRAMGYLCTTYDINPMCHSWDIVLTSLCYIHTLTHTHTCIHVCLYVCTCITTRPRTMTWIHTWLLRTFFTTEDKIQVLGRKQC